MKKEGFFERAGKVVDRALSPEGRKELLRYAYAVKVAKADPIEAMHGHYCGPLCMHVGVLNETEREALKRRAGWDEWPSDVMARYDAEQGSK